MKQFYRHDEDEIKAYNVFQDLVEPFRLSVQGYYENIGVEPSVGLVLRELGVVPFSNTIQPTLFCHVYGLLINMIQDWGLYDVLNFMTAVYGIPIEIEINPPMNVGMIANIDPSNVEETYWIANNKTPAIKFEDTDYIVGKVSSEDFYMVFTKLLGDILSIEQLRILLQHLRPAGERWTVNYRG